MARISTRLALIPLMAAAIGAVAAPAPALAAWNGLRDFSCENSNANWHFDGLYGPDTTRAVRAFQRDQGMEVTGVADSQTLHALGLTYKRTLRCGMGGKDVLSLQSGLAHAGYWAGGHGHHAAPTPTPMETPMATPTPMETPMATPSPMETPQATPSPEPSAEATPEEQSNMPTLDVRGGTWLVPILGFWYIPTGGNQYNYDFSAIRNSFFGDADLWYDNWGVGGDIVNFNLASNTFVGPLFNQNGTLMYDGALEYRWDRGFWKAFAGYRGLNVDNLNFGKVGVAFEHPIASDWLWFNAKLQGGSNFSNGYFVDGQAGLDLHFGWLGLGLGFRDMELGIGGAPVTTINGPMANVEVKF